MGYLIPVTPQDCVNRKSTYDIIGYKNKVLASYIHISQLQLTIDCLMALRSK